MPVQVGGGLRTLDAIRAVADAGATRLILGTAAFRDPEFLKAAVAAYPEQVVVSVDARDGQVAAAGWTEVTRLTVGEALSRLQARGVRRFVYSNIERDGMLTGPDLEGVRAVASAIEDSFVYSGGIGTLSDLEALAELREPKLARRDRRQGDLRASHRRRGRTGHPGPLRGLASSLGCITSA